MPAVEKIKNTNDNIQGIEFLKGVVVSAILTVDINCVFEAVIHFVKWYNENNK